MNTINKLKKKIREDNLYLPEETGFISNKHPDDINYMLEKDISLGIVSLKTIKELEEKLENANNLTGNRFERILDLARQIKHRMTNKVIYEDNDDFIKLLNRLRYNLEKQIRN